MCYPDLGQRELGILDGALLQMFAWVQVDVGDVYCGRRPGQDVYRLRSMVCYYGAHYFAFVLVPDLGRWLIFDDTRVSNIGGWGDVRRKCELGRIQPSVLFYEAEKR